MKCRGFTLVELVVVIAIIALLMAILAPSLHSSKRRAKAVLCGANINQLVLGLTMYETENETFPYAFDDTPMAPPPTGYSGDLAYDRMGWWWFNYIAGYLGKDKKTVLWCPSRQIIDHRLKNNILCGNHGVNQSICKSSSGRHSDFIGTPLGSSDISHPGQTLLVVDSGYSMITWCHATNRPPITLDYTIIEDAAYIPGIENNKEKEKDLWPGQAEDAINGRHPNKSLNVGFADGHISRVKADDLYVEENEGNYSNRSPLWLPK